MKKNKNSLLELYKIQEIQTILFFAIALNLVNFNEIFLGGSFLIFLLYSINSLNRLTLNEDESLNKINEKIIMTSTFSILGSALYLCLNDTSLLILANFFSLCINISNFNFTKRLISENKNEIPNQNISFAKYDKHVSKAKEINSNTYDK